MAPVVEEDARAAGGGGLFNNNERGNDPGEADVGVARRRRNGRPSSKVREVLEWDQI